MPICLFQSLISFFHHPFVRPPEYCPSSKHSMHLNIVYNIQFIIGIDPAFTPSIIPLRCPICCVLQGSEASSLPYATAFHLQLPIATSYAIPTWCANHYCPSRPFLNYAERRNNRMANGASICIRTEHHQLDWLRSGKWGVGKLERWRYNTLVGSVLSVLCTTILVFDTFF